MTAIRVDTPPGPGARPGAVALLEAVDSAGPGLNLVGERPEAASRDAERAEELAALGTLAAGIAHEINNPLNSIMMNAELGLMQLESGADASRLQSILQTIIEDVGRCTAITSSVLNLSNPRSEGSLSREDLNSIAVKACDLIDSHLQMHDSTVALDLGDIPALDLDAVAMESALINLLRNAAESSPSGVTVTMRTRPEGDQVLVEVSDDGPGMPADVRSQIFDPFFTTKRGDKGTGLGLSLVHRTITDHGGTIRARERRPSGTTFEIRLPRPRD